MQTPSDQRREAFRTAFHDQLERQIRYYEIRIEHCEDEKRSQAFRKEITALARLQSRLVSVKH